LPDTFGEGGALQSIAVVSLILAFLPFIASLSGRGLIWKFLSLLFCCFSIAGAVSIVGVGGGILAWVVAWIFTAVAASARRSEDRFKRLERQLLAEQRDAAAASPVDRILLKQDRGGSRPLRIGAIALICAVVAVLVLVTSRANRVQETASKGKASDLAEEVTSVGPPPSRETASADDRRNPRPVDAVIFATADRETLPTIFGVTNLPDDTKLLVSLRRKEANYFAQANAVVLNGQFRSDRFTAAGKPLPPGNYTLEILMPLAAVQTSSVQQIIGKEGERLTGKLVEHSQFGITLKSVSVTNIGGASSRSADEAARRESEVAMEKWRRESCAQIQLVSQGQRTTADCLAKLNPR
jgi:hypothetical protein